MSLTHQFLCRYCENGEYAYESFKALYNGKKMILPIAYNALGRMAKTMQWIHENLRSWIVCYIDLI